MIIISNKPGQLGNLLFIYAHFLAYGLENNVSISNPSFYEYRSYFASTSGFSLYRNKLMYSACYAISRVLVRMKIKNRFIHVMALDWEEHVELENAPELKSKFCFVQGWLFRAEALFAKHQEYIRSFFAPEQSLKHKLDLFFKENFPVKPGILIGIHIRRGDYRTFENGAYFYAVEQYLDIMDRLATLFKDRDPVFMIASNETIQFPENRSRDLNMVFAPGHELLDMYSLAQCDYIAGPPSTYSMWASFYGRKPLYMIKDIHATIQEKDFKNEFSH